MTLKGRNKREKRTEARGRALAAIGEKVAVGELRGQDLKGFENRKNTLKKLGRFVKIQKGAGQGLLLIIETNEDIGFLFVCGD